jgi:hypothetical protein
LSIQDLFCRQARGIQALFADDEILERLERSRR